MGFACYLEGSHFCCDFEGNVRQLWVKETYVSKQLGVDALYFAVDSLFIFLSTYCTQIIFFHGNKNRKYLSPHKLFWANYGKFNYD